MKSPQFVIVAFSVGITVIVAAPTTAPTPADAATTPTALHFFFSVTFLLLILYIAKVFCFWGVEEYEKLEEKKEEEEDEEKAFEIFEISEVFNSKSKRDVAKHTSAVEKKELKKSSSGGGCCAKV